MTLRRRRGSESLDDESGELEGLADARRPARTDAAVDQPGVEDTSTPLRSRSPGAAARPRRATGSSADAAARWNTLRPMSEAATSDAAATRPADSTGGEPSGDAASRRKSAKKPLYPRLLRLQHIRPNAWQRAALGEGAIGVGVLLAMADLASAWAIVVLPVAVAGIVKAHDALQGMLDPRTEVPPTRDQPAADAAAPPRSEDAPPFHPVTGADDATATDPQERERRRTSRGRRRRREEQTD